MGIVAGGRERRTRVQPRPAEVNRTPGRQGSDAAEPSPRGSSVSLRLVRSVRSSAHAVCSTRPQLIAQVFRQLLRQFSALLSL